MSRFHKIKRKLKCNKPTRDKQGDKTHKVLACKDGEEKIVRFGHSMPDGTSNKDRRKSYCARSGGIKGKNDKFSANYWSRKAWKCRD